MKNIFLKNGVLVAVALVVLGSTFYTGVYVGSEKMSGASSAAQVTSIINKEPVAGVSTTTDFAPFWIAWNVLNEKYVSSKKIPGDQERVWGAIKGLTASLGDPYTVFFPPEESKNFENDIAGNFEGVGMEVGIRDDVLTVVSPLKGSPAERAGILSGDKILKINDTDTKDMSVESAVKLIRGKKGTEVRLTIYRDNKVGIFEKKVVREVIDIPTIDTEIKQVTKAGVPDTSGTGLTKDGVYIIRLYSFSANSHNLFRGALRGFLESGSNKLILDLRGNPGGYLEAAWDMASWFLPPGKVVVSEDSGKNGVGKVYKSKGYGRNEFGIFNKDLKMIILVNGGSASASEILAGALKEHGVAKLVGTKTFGKGSVQELVKITPDTSLKVTIARWLTPLGHSISEGGLKPDYEVTMTQEDVEKKKDPQQDKAIELLTK
ncbi:S41 family peptidase [Patescibacteria group bacterium]|nr:MAG: S41 family peptidase [Patescibacteria group bacterium]